MPKASPNGKQKKVCFKDEIAEIIGAITKRGVTDKQLAVYFYETYEDFAKKHDSFGRTALHMAASCGRSELCQWLINVGGANINERDGESGYTPLHRALFHGHINSAIRILQLGADPLILDKEGLTAIDIAVKDRPSQVEIGPLVPCQLYIWGSNDNYTLGTGTNKSRKVPELLENFKRKNVSIKQVCMDEYHSVFVSSCSRVWVCGNGQGGRLGIATDRHVLTPKVLGVGANGCLMAATALNHTLLLLTNGTVLACGQNEHYQLGVSPYAKNYISPKPVTFRHLVEPLVGVCAGKYHSVFYGKMTLFTCGLNGGQLGHPHYEKSRFIEVPTQVPINIKSKSYISHVASSSTCVVFSLSSGEIYSLYQFQFNKIASKQLDVCQIATCGGCLQSKVVNVNNGVLKIVLLSSGGTIKIWQETNPHLTRCIFGLSRLISISSIFLTDSKILFTTSDGEAYIGTIGQIAKQTVKRSSQEEKSGFHKFVEKSECYHISSCRIPNIHRAVSITSDPKGKNMGVIQTNPINALTDVPIQSLENVYNQFSRLLDEASEEDNLHDVIFKVQKNLFPAHEYIIACNSSSFLSLPREGKIIEINDIHPTIFKEILAFFYSGWCSLLNEGPVNISFSSLKDNPLRLAIDICNKYKISSLYKKIVCYRYENGCIKLKDNALKPVLAPHEFNRALFPELYDIQVSSEDGKLFKAHKCILVARLEYFHSMLMGGWLETIATPVLHLDCPSSALEVFLDFLYTNTISESLQSDGFEGLGRLLVMSDQLLCNDIKEYCELALANIINLKNASTILHLSFLYNSTQLKRTVMQFISLNMDTFIENRSLEELSDDVLIELEKYHREFNCSKFDKRIITPLQDFNIADEVILSHSSESWPVNNILRDKDVKDEKTPPKNIVGAPRKRTPKKSISLMPEPADSMVTKESEIHSPMTEEIKKDIIPLNLASSPPDYADYPSLENDSFSKKSARKPKYNSPKMIRPIPFRKLLKKEQEKCIEAIDEPVVTKPHFKGWATITPPSSVENTEIPLFSSPPQASSFVEIIASEQQAKHDFIKMKGKAFHLTQLEDKAMEELRDFYNAPNIFDERITVYRVTSLYVPKPTWVKTNKTLFH